MALKPAGKTLSSLTGIVVMAAALWLILNFVYAPSCGRFACSYVPAWWPQAEADSGDACPDDITGAADDAAWAADRIEALTDQDAKRTIGLFYDQDGAETTYTSGYDAAEQALRGTPGLSSLRPVGTRQPRTWKPRSPPRCARAALPMASW